MKFLFLMQPNCKQDAYVLSEQFFDDLNSEKLKFHYGKSLSNNLHLLSFAFELIIEFNHKAKNFIFRLFHIKFCQNVSYSILSSGEVSQIYQFFCKSIQKHMVFN